MQVHLLKSRKCKLWKTFLQRNTPLYAASDPIKPLEVLLLYNPTAMYADDHPKVICHLFILGQLGLVEVEFNF